MNIHTKCQLFVERRKKSCYGTSRFILPLQSEDQVKVSVSDSDSDSDSDY